MSEKLPLRLSGEVVRGFGRGSRLLGFPTANLSAVGLEQSIASMAPGVYFGFGAIVPRREVFPCVLNVGWNPTFGENSEKILECHLIDRQLEDFYGATLRVVVLGFLRSERKFSGVAELKQQIAADVHVARDSLTHAEHSVFSGDAFLL